MDVLDSLEDVESGGTISRMRVGVDETRVEDLLRKRPDQLVRRLQTETPSSPSTLQALESHLSAVTHVFQAQSLSSDFL